MRVSLLFLCCLFSLFINAELNFSDISNEVESRKQKYPLASVWNVDTTNITDEELKALNFLISSMPLSDLFMWDGNYYLNNVRTSLKARKEMAWGKDVPDEVFYHFVLPVRGNNEYLDDFRTTYYEELKKRVSGLSLYEAALEINHWCHEKVTYEPSDPRTSSPMATMRTSKGRCGEESVFAVAAFRAVGIPARQVYTPRWAHTDNNHAWVEVWVDGQWYFLGACEPEPELNRAWFNNPVSRGLLMHTRVFGDYNGKEQIIDRQNGITEINVVDNYVPTHINYIKLVNSNGEILKNHTVEFKIYNYSEFYTAARVTTDENGIAQLMTGKGDMLVWAAKDGYFGFAKINGGETELKLSHKVGERISLDIDIIPPVDGNIASEVTDEQIAENARRFAEEDEIRMAYMNTFFTPDSSDYTDKRIIEILSAAKGNWRNVKAFIDAVPSDRLEEAISMLYAVSAKDLRDVPTEVLLGTLLSTTPQVNELYIPYVLNPRISYEMLSDYRQEIRKYLSTSDVDKIISYIKDNIKVVDGCNTYNVPIIPSAVIKNKVSDRQSRNICFVATCRANGIPARINSVNGSTQYHNGNDWVDVKFEEETIIAEVLPKGVLKATYSPIAHLSDPQYFRHFSISDLSSGSPQLLEFDENSAKWSNILKDGVTLNEGYYLVISGTRMANGSVLAHMEFLNIEGDKITEFPLTMRYSETEISVIGEMNPEELYLPYDTDVEKSILSTTGRGYFLIVILDKTNEPSNHAVLELQAATELLNKWNRPVLVLSDIQREELSSINNLNYGRYSEKIANMLRNGINSQRKDLPIISIADSFGRIVFISEGYDTSLFEKLSNVIPQL